MWVNEIYLSFGSRCKSRVIVNHGLVVVVVVVKNTHKNKQGGGTAEALAASSDP